MSTKLIQKKNDRLKKIWCYSGNRYRNKKKLPNQKICVCMCIYIPFSSEKGMVLSEISKRVTVLLWVFQWTRQKRKKKKKHKKWTVNDKVWPILESQLGKGNCGFSSSIQNPFFCHHLSLLHIECSIFPASHLDKM